MKRINSILLVALTSFSLVACERQNAKEDEKINPLKTQLYISNFDGGVGTEWLYQTKKLFEEKYKNVSFEEGKTGVQIMVDPNMNNGEIMLDTFAGSTIDIMFNENVKYNSWVYSKDLFLDITDVVKSTCEGETKTIEDKLYTDQKDFLPKNGKYYALPHYNTFEGIIYDIDLFDKKGLYFSKDTDNGNDGFIVKGEEKSVGPDGISGTLDDGLPSSYEEFFKLCDYMVQRGVTPFVWTCQYAAAYLPFLLNAVYQNYEGYEDSKLMYTYDSGSKTTEIVKGFVDGDLDIENVQITSQNGYLLKQQPGRYYAIDFLSKILSNSLYYYASSTGDLTFSHTDAQEVYINSSLKNEPIAFIIEGTWWENETKLSLAYDRAVNKYGEAAENRHYGFLPLPSLATGRVEEGQGQKEVLYDALESYAAINKNIDANKIDLAKKFLKFCYSDEMLQLFTTVTGVAKCLNYSLDADDYNALSNFSKNIWDLKNNSEIGFTNSSSRFYIENQSDLTFEPWASSVGGLYEMVYTHLRNKKSSKDIFIGNFIQESTWTNKYFK